MTPSSTSNTAVASCSGGRSRSGSSARSGTSSDEPPQASLLGVGELVVLEHCREHVAQGVPGLFRSGGEGVGDGVEPLVTAVLERVGDGVEQLLVCHHRGGVHLLVLVPGQRDGPVDEPAGARLVAVVERAQRLVEEVRRGIHLGLAERREGGRRAQRDVAQAPVRLLLHLALDASRTRSFSSTSATYRRARARGVSRSASEGVRRVRPWTGGHHSSRAPGRWTSRWLGRGSSAGVKPARLSAHPVHPCSVTR